MKIINHIISLSTNATLDFIDITEKVATIIKENSVKEGVINIQSMHTTMAVILQEAEPLLLGDIKATLERLAPRTAQYMHDNFDIRTVNMNPNEPINGHSHCKAVFLTPGIFLNIVGRKLQLGQWQRVFAVELVNARPSRIARQIIGE